MATHSSVLAWKIPGTGSLVGCRLWGRTESDTTKATQQQQCIDLNCKSIEIETNFAWFLYLAALMNLFIRSNSFSSGFPMYKIMISLRRGSSSFSIWMPFVSFSLTSCPGQNFQTVSNRVNILILFLFLVGSVKSFTTEYVSPEFFIDAHSQVVEASFCSQILECFYHERVLGSNAFFVSVEMIVSFFPISLY